MGDNNHNTFGGGIRYVQSYNCTPGFQLSISRRLPYRSPVREDYETPPKHTKKKMNSSNHSIRSESLKYIKKQHTTTITR